MADAGIDPDNNPAGIIYRAVFDYMNASSVSPYPATINEIEYYNSGISGAFNLNEDHYDAHWTNGAEAVLTVVQWDEISGVILERNDQSGTSSGLTARYTGNINGNSITDGTVTWTDASGTRSGTWTASW